jgi:N-acetylneuraminic acid mutarotase
MPLAWLDGKIYVAGGFNVNGAATALIETYSPSRDSWSRFSDLPASLHHFGLVALHGKLYAIGGYSGNGFFSQGRVYEYDFSRGSWEAKRTMLTPRGAHVAAVWGEKIYAIGGANGGSAMATNEVYDPATEQWTRLAPMPTPREHLAAAVIDSLIYVVGGRRSSFVGNLDNLPRLEAYSPATNKWYELPEMPTARGGLAAAALRGKLYVFGGEFFSASGNGVFAENEEYDPRAQTWRAVRPLPTPRHGMNAIAIDDTIFVIGGGPVAGFGVTAANEGFTFAPEPTRVESEAEEARTFALQQNYPNPFNAATNLTFVLRQAERVTLQVHDVRGKIVAVLAQGVMNAGEHTLNFESHELASGVYYFALRTPAATRVRKMLLLR